MRNAVRAGFWRSPWPGCAGPRHAGSLLVLKRGPAAGATHQLRKMPSFDARRSGYVALELRTPRRQIGITAPLGRRGPNVAGWNFRTISMSDLIPQQTTALRPGLARSSRPAEATMSKKRKTISNLEARDCRWPIGDPRQEGFHFCGEPQVPGQSYCGEHLRLAFQPPRPRHSQATPPLRVPQAA